MQFVVPRYGHNNKDVSTDIENNNDTNLVYIMINLDHRRVEICVIISSLVNKSTYRYSIM